MSHFDFKSVLIFIILVVTMYDSTGLHLSCRISEEVVEMKHELVELRMHISSQGLLVQDLMTGVFRELEG